VVDVKEIKIGNTIGIIHSPLMALSKEERRAHFETELAAGNPVLKELERIINESYIKRMKNGA
jgi:homoserine dehydrogenase